MNNFVKISLPAILIVLFGCASQPSMTIPNDSALFNQRSGTSPGYAKSRLQGVSGLVNAEDTSTEVDKFIRDWWIIKVDEKSDVKLNSNGTLTELIKADINLNFQGIFVDTDISLTYSEVDGAFEFIYPLAPGASVNRFILTVGDRKIRAIITSSKDAEDIYEEARRVGLKAAVISKNEFREMLLKSYNREAQQVKIDFSYSDLARYKNGRHHFSIPAFTESAKAKTSVSLKVKNNLSQDFRFQGRAIKMSKPRQKLEVSLDKKLNFDFELPHNENVYIAEHRGVTAYAIWNKEQKKLTTGLNRDLSKFTTGVKIDGRALITTAAYDLINSMIGLKRSAASISRQAIKYQILTGMTSQLVVDTIR